MARRAMIVKAQRTAKFTTRTKNRCQQCGRSRAYMRKFGLCRICFRNLAHKGELPGVIKASW
jgi:small subunit ribosomal protein S14